MEENKERDVLFRKVLNRWIMQMELNSESIFQEARVLHDTHGKGAMTVFSESKDVIAGVEQKVAVKYLPQSLLKPNVNLPLDERLKKYDVEKHCVILVGIQDSTNLDLGGHYISRIITSDARRILIKKTLAAWIQQMQLRSHELCQEARDKFNIHSRGAMVFFGSRNDIGDKKPLEMKYLTQDQLPTNAPLEKRIKDYDPEVSCVIVAGLEDTKGRRYFISQIISPNTHLWLET